MEIRIPKAELSKALSYTQRLAESKSKSTMPILNNLLLVASNGQLTITASDFEVSAVAHVNAEVIKEGKVAVSGKTFSEIARELPEGIVQISTNEAQRVQLKTDSGVTNIIGISADEYPDLPAINLNATCKYDAKQLLEMVSKTIYAVSQDETRFNLNGVCFCLEKDGEKNKILRLVGTDGHRLALISRPAGELNFEGRIIVPKKGLSELKKLLETLDGDTININVKNGFLVVDTPNVKLSMRLIDGEFPDFNHIIPKEKGMIAKVQSGILSQSLRRVMLMVTDKNKGVRFDFSKNNLKIFSSSDKIGDATEEIEIEYSGDDISVCYNAFYIAEMAMSVKEEQILCIDVHGISAPGIFYVEDDESYIGIVMPMHLI